MSSSPLTAHTVIGMDADLMKALGGVMGLKVNVVNATFDSIIPGLAAGKYDIGASSFTDTKAREKTVDFVDYFTAGESFYTKASGGTPIGSIADLCGKTVAVEKGTTEETDATTQSGKCKKAGKPAVKVLSFPDQNGANLALSSGRASSASPTRLRRQYQVKKSGGQFKLVGLPYANAPYGLAIAKNSGPDKAVLAALKVLMKNGHYTAILPMGYPGRRDLATRRSTERRVSWQTALRGEHLRASEDRTGRPEDIKAVPVRHPGRWVAAAIVLIIAAR